MQIGRAFQVCFALSKSCGNDRPCMVPAIIAVALVDVALSVMQGSARLNVYLFWLHSPAPETLRNLVYFAFIFTFASVRLCITLAILVFAAHRSCQPQCCRPLEIGRHAPLDPPAFPCHMRRQ